MKILIVDDSALVRERLRTMLCEFAEIEVVGEAQNPLEAISSIRQAKPDAVILDIRMPGGSGIDVLHKVKKDKLAPMVIILTNYPYPQYRKKCIDAGADFFLDKSTEFDKITEIFKHFTGRS